MGNFYGEYWEGRTNSDHRSTDPKFFERKASEHSGLMTPHERASPCLDLGCGAGELLEHLQHHVNVVVGLDFSRSMLEAARRRLGDSPIELLNVELFAYLSAATEPTWMTTGAANQYLDPNQTERFLQAFADNTSAKSLFLFDCVDPIRFATLRFGSSYSPAHRVSVPQWQMRLRSVARRSQQTTTGLRLMVGSLSRGSQSLRRHNMGFAYLPHRWRAMIAAHDLECEFVSSLFYEYRFHIVVRKRLDMMSRDVV